MKIIKANIWDYWTKGCTIIIPTNGYVKKSGSCVMGRGLARQAKVQIVGIEFKLGEMIKQTGNHVYYLSNHLFSFPVKNNWYEKAKLSLIIKSAKELKAGIGSYSLVCLSKVGCGNGGLNWKEVEPILDEYLNDSRFIIVDLK